MGSRQVYLEASHAYFNVVADTILKSSDNLAFWHVGRAYKTCSNYVTKFGAHYPLDGTKFYDEVRPACKKFYIAQAGKPSNDKWWWDDYGWWGVAHLGVGDVSDAVDCWQRMKTYGVDGSGVSGPDYSGGCWNHGPSQDPSGCENSVTNMLFFLLSLRLLNDERLANEPIRKEILKAAAAWVVWFEHWPHDSIFNPIGLLRERPVGDSGQYFPNGQPTYEVGCIWTGDQGLALAWAASAFNLAESDWNVVFPGKPYRISAIEFALKLRRAMDVLFDDGGVLHEAPFNANSWGDYNVDYCTGRGVFMRCVSHADEVFRNQPGWVDSDEVARKTADAVIANAAPNPRYFYSWRYSTEQAILDAWNAKFGGHPEGRPLLCNDASTGSDAKSELVFYSIALDAVTAAAVATP